MAWYWLVDPDERTVLVLRLDGSTYRVEASLQADDRYCWSAYSEVRVDLARLFEPL